MLLSPVAMGLELALCYSRVPNPNPASCGAPKRCGRVNLTGRIPWTARGRASKIGSRTLGTRHDSDNLGYVFARFARHGGPDGERDVKCLGVAGCSTVAVNRPRRRCRDLPV